MLSPLKKNNMRLVKGHQVQESQPLIELSHSDAKVSLPTTNCILFIKLKEISYFKADDVYAVMHDIHGDTHFITKSMKWIEERLKFSTFYRVHKSYFINLYNVSKFTRKDGGDFIMECGDLVPVSRRRRGEIGVVLGL